MRNEEKIVTTFAFDEFFVRSNVGSDAAGVTAHPRSYRSSRLFIMSSYLSEPQLVSNHVS